MNIKKSLVANPDIICLGYYDYTKEGSFLPRSNVMKSGFYRKKDLIESVYNKMLFVQPFYTFYILPSVWSKCFKKELLKKVYPSIPDSISLGEDAALTYTAILNANNIYVSDYKGYNYWHLAGSMTKGYRKELHQSVEALFSYFIHLKKVARWNDGNQLDMYCYYIMSYAITNEFYFNYSGSYTEKINNIEKYFTPEIMHLLKKVRVKGVSENVKLCCLKKHFWTFLILYYSIKHRLSRN